MFFLQVRRPPISTRTDTLFPVTTLFRSCFGVAVLRPQPAGLREGAGIFALGIIRAGDERTIATPAQRQPPLAAIGAQARIAAVGIGREQRSEERRVGKEVSVRVDLGGRRIIKKKKKRTIYKTLQYELYKPQTIHPDQTNNHIHK